MRTCQKLVLIPAVGIMFLTPSITHGAAAVAEWVQRYNGVGNKDDVPAAVVVDGNGDVTVAGSEGPYYATIKFSSAGLPLWTNVFGIRGPRRDGATALAVNAEATVFVTGASTNVAGGTTGDFLTLAYSKDGVLLWTNLYNGPGKSTDVAVDIRADPNGDVVVTGYSQGSGTGLDFATIKYSGSGMPLWTNRYDGVQNRDDRPVALAVDRNGNVFVTGFSNVTNGPNSGFNAVILAYSAAGEPLWTNYIVRGLYEATMANAIAVGEDAIVVVGGVAGGDPTWEFLTIAYSPQGAPLWTNYYGPPEGYHGGHGNAVAVDRSGNVYVTGDCQPLWQNSYDYATVKYSATGLPLWTNYYNGPGSKVDWPYALACDESGCVFVTGESQAINNHYDLATIAYSESGVPLWTNRYDGPDSLSEVGATMVARQSLAVSGTGAVVVIGRSQAIHGSSTNYDFVVVKYLSVPTAVSISQRGIGTNQLVFSGMPGTEYITQFAPDIGSSLWFDLSTNMPSPDGSWWVVDDAATNRSRFYRALTR